MATGCIINALIDLNLVDKFGKIYCPSISSMENVRLEIKTKAARFSSGNKSSSASSTSTVAQPIVLQTKIQLSLFDSNLLE